MLIKLQLIVELVDIGLGSRNRISFCVYRFSRTISCLARTYQCFEEEDGNKVFEMGHWVPDNYYYKYMKTFLTFPSPSITVSSPSNQYVNVKKHSHEKATLGDLYPRHMRVDYIFKCF